MKKRFVLLFAVLLLFVGHANAQLTTNASINVTVNVQMNSSILLSESGGSLIINPTNGQSNSVTFTTIWNLGPTNSITLYSWFSNPTSALSASAGASNIPSSAVAATFTSVNGNPGVVSAGSGSPCNQVVGVGNGVVDGAACQPSLLAGPGSQGLGTTGGTIGTTGTATTTYSLALLNYPFKVAAGSFTGVLNVAVISL
jgi:hypothetical protein